MNCSSHSELGESACRTRFSLCSDQITEEDDQRKGLPSVPGLDLQSLRQSQPGFLSCLLLLYNCSASRAECGQQFSQCSQQYPVLDQTNTARDQLPPVTSKDGLQDAAVTRSDEVPAVTRRDEVPAVTRPPNVSSSPDIYTPSLAGGSGKIPESKLVEFCRERIFVLIDFMSTIFCLQIVTVMMV